MSRNALVIDYKYCTGCHTCEVGCRKEKKLPVEEWGIRLTEHGPAMIDGQWMWNYVPVPSSVCDCCAERLEAGDKPYCVKHCLAQCMQVVAVEDLFRVLEELGNDVAVFVR